MKEKIEAAVGYALRGWSVFPLRPNSKEPWTAHGFLDATNNPNWVEQIWTAYPNANIGIRTGSESGLVVIDVDVKDSVNGCLSASELDLPETLVSRTPSGGFHYYYQHPGTTVHCKVGYRPGIDIRGDGGYVLGVGSMINGVSYTWSVEAKLGWLSIDLEKNNTEEIRFGKNIPKGRRNTELVRLAGMLVNAGCTQEEIHSVLRIRNQICCHPPLSDGEILQLSRSAARNFDCHPEMLENVIIDLRQGPGTRENCPVETVPSQDDSSSYAVVARFLPE